MSTQNEIAKKTKHHIKRHKKKYVAGTTVALIITLLELYPLIRQAISTGDTAPIAEFGKSKLLELQDAGIIE